MPASVLNVEIVTGGENLIPVRAKRFDVALFDCVADHLFDSDSTCRDVELGDGFASSRRRGSSGELDM